MASVLPDQTNAPMAQMSWPAAAWTDSSRVPSRARADRTVPRRARCTRNRRNGAWWSARAETRPSHPNLRYDGGWAPHAALRRVARSRESVGRHNVAALSRRRASTRSRRPVFAYHVMVTWRAQRFRGCAASVASPRRSVVSPLHSAGVRRGATAPPTRSRGAAWRRAPRARCSQSSCWSHSMAAARCCSRGAGRLAAAVRRLATAHRGGEARCNRPADARARRCAATGAW